MILMIPGGIAIKSAWLANPFAGVVRAGDLRDDSSLQAPEVIRGIPERYADNVRQFQGIASLEVCSRDRLWACWYAGGNGEEYENYVIVSTSGDAGKTWTIALTIDPDGPGPVRAYDSTLWQDSKGVLHIYWTQSNHYFDGRCGVWTMQTENPEDGENALWSAPRRLCDGIMMDKPTVDSKGRILYPVSLWRNEPTDAFPEIPKGTFVYLSQDDGRTVSLLGKTFLPLENSLYDEHSIIEKKDGTFRMFIRTKTGMAEATSRDGVTWSDAVPSKIQNTSARFFVRRLMSGALLLVKNGPIDKDVSRTRLTAYISDDDGDTWTGGLLLDERGEISYPDGGQSDDGIITIVYDYNRFSDREILCARFTEEDVRNGKPVSPQCELRILINKATGKMP